MSNKIRAVFECRNFIHSAILQVNELIPDEATSVEWLSNGSSCRSAVMVSMKALSLLVAEPQDWMLTKITMDLKSDDGTATVSQEIYPAKILTAQAPPKMGG